MNHETSMSIGTGLQLFLKHLREISRNMGVKFNSRALELLFKSGPSVFCDNFSLNRDLDVKVTRPYAQAFKRELKAARRRNEFIINPRILPDVKSFDLSLNVYDNLAAGSQIVTRLPGAATLETNANRSANRYLLYMYTQLLQSWRRYKAATTSAGKADAMARYNKLVLLLVSRSHAYLVAHLHHVDKNVHRERPARWLVKTIKRINELRGLIGPQGRTASLSGFEMLTRMRSNIEYSRVHINDGTKGPGETRPLGVPTFAWRVYLSMIQTTLPGMLPPRPEQHGFCPGRGTITASKIVITEIVPAAAVYEIDLKGCFPSITSGLVQTAMQAADAPREYSAFISNINNSKATLTEAQTTHAGYDYHKHHEYRSSLGQLQSFRLDQLIQHYNKTGIQLVPLWEQGPDGRPLITGYARVDAHTVLNGMAKQDPNLILQIRDTLVCLGHPAPSMLGPCPDGLSPIGIPNKLNQVLLDKLSMELNSPVYIPYTMSRTNLGSEGNFNDYVFHSNPTGFSPGLSFVEMDKTRYGNGQFDPNILHTGNLPQGSPISPYCATTLISFVLTKVMANHPAVKVLLYADDMIFYSDDSEALQDFVSTLGTKLAEGGLILHAKKSQWVKMNGNWIKDGLKFLGVYHHSDGRIEARTRKGATLAYEFGALESNYQQAIDIANSNKGLTVLGRTLIGRMVKTLGYLGVSHKGLVQQLLRLAHADPRSLSYTAKITGMYETVKELKRMSNLTEGMLENVARRDPRGIQSIENIQMLVRRFFETARPVSPFSTPLGGLLFARLYSNSLNPKFKTASGGQDFRLSRVPTDRVYSGSLCNQMHSRNPDLITIHNSSSYWTHEAMQMSLGIVTRKGYKLPKTFSAVSR